MNKEEYLKRKNQNQEIKTYRTKCLKCLRPDEICLCSTFKAFQTSTHFVILMHPKEAKKERVGTGRVSHTMLLNSQIIIGENFDNDIKVQKILNDPKNFCMILYPGEDSHNISEEKLVIGDKQLVIFVIDGTWPCAKSMMRDSKSLHHIAKISFTLNQKSAFSIKQQPGDYCLSTIESLYQTIQGLKKSELETIKNDQDLVLLKSLERIVEFQIQCANDPSRNNYRKSYYKNPSERKVSKKHMTRKICFESENYNAKISSKEKL